MSKKRMFYRIALSTLVVSGIALGGSCPAQDAPAGSDPTTADADRQPTVAEIGELIAELGADSFQNREAAMAELLSIGPRALPALNRLRSDSDPEVRERIETIRERLVQDDLEERIENFLSSEEGYLPGWEYARTRIGDRQTTRELFVEITRRYPELAASLEESERERAVAMEQATQKLLLATRSVSNEPSLADAISLLLVAADEKTPANELTDGMILGLVNRHEVARGLSDSQLMEPFRRLLGQWIQKVSKSRRRDALAFAMHANLREGLSLARATLRDGDDPDALEYALQTVARFGSRPDTLLVKPLLDDQRAAGQGYVMLDAAGRPLSVLLGDVAMATIAVVHKRRLRDVGFPAAETHPVVAFNVDTLGFPVGAAGDAARQRVREEVDAMVEALEQAEEESQ